MLLAGEHRLDRRADLGAGAVGLALRRRQIEAGLSPEVDLRAPAMLGQMGFVGLRAVGGVGPDVARRVGRIEDVGQLRPVMGGRAGDGEAADEAVLAVDRDVRLVAEHRDGDLDLGLRAVRLRRARLGPLQRPAGVAVLLRELLRLGRPRLRDPALLQSRLLGIGVALTRGRDDRGVDDLARHREIALALQPGVEGGKQIVDRTGPRQVLAEQPHRLGVRHRILEAQAEEAHEREPIPDLELRGVVRQRVERLKDQDLEHQHRVVGRAATLRSIGPLQCGGQLRSESLEVDQGRELHQRVAVLRQTLIALIQIEEPWLTHPSLPNADSIRESRHRPARKGYFEVSERPPFLSS